MSDQVVLSFL